MKPTKWAWGWQNLNFSQFREVPLFTAANDLSDMFHVLLLVLVRDNYVIDYLPDALYPSKGFVHSPVVVLTDG